MAKFDHENQMIKTKLCDLIKHLEYSINLHEPKYW